MKILLATDGSKYSERALRTIVKEYRTEGVKVRVLHVIEEIHAYISAGLIPHYVPRVAKVERARRIDAEKLVERSARALHKAGFEASTVVATGDPKSAIIDQAKKWNADLIVVGSHGWKGFNRFLMGSVSEAVIRHAGCSVEVVRISAPANRTTGSKSRRSM